MLFVISGQNGSNQAFSMTTAGVSYSLISVDHATAEAVTLGIFSNKPRWKPNTLNIK